MSDLFPVTLAEQIVCVEREVKMRERVYERRVADRRMTQAQADKEIRVMLAVLNTLSGIKATTP